MTRKSFKIFTVDAFTKQAFRGNAATVVLLDDDQDIRDELKQMIAAEMRTSETAFVSKKRPQSCFDTDSDFALRWFTINDEVPLCGHATLATAAALFENGNVNNRLTFETKSGTLTATKMADGKITLNLPRRSTVPLDQTVYESLIRSVVGDHLSIEDVVYSAEERTVVVRLHDDTTMAQFENIQPSFDEMITFSGGDVALRGVNVTLKGSRKNGCVHAVTGEVYDFVSRHFAPWYGVPEDPVTGSAHAVLGPYWAERLGGRTFFFARQASERGGDVCVELVNDDRIEVGGHWVCVRKGELYA